MQYHGTHAVNNTKKMVWTKKRKCYGQQRQLQPSKIVIVLTFGNSCSFSWVVPDVYNSLDNPADWEVKCKSHLWHTTTLFRSKIVLCRTDNIPLNNLEDSSHSGLFSGRLWVPQNTTMNMKNGMSYCVSKHILVQTGEISTSTSWNFLL